MTTQFCFLRFQINDITQNFCILEYSLKAELSIVKLVANITQIHGVKFLTMFSLGPTCPTQRITSKPVPHLRAE